MASQDINSAKLPYELWLNVFACLRGDSKTLSQLALVSIAFNQLSTLHLYHAFHHIHGDECKSRLCPTFRFVRTLIDGPDLADFVKRVSGDPLGTISRREVSQSPTLSSSQGRNQLFEATMEICSKLFLHDSSSHFWSLWTKGFAVGAPWGVCTLLMCLLPSLETMQLQLGTRNPMLKRIFEAIPRVKSGRVPFSQLRELQFPASLPSPSYGPLQDISYYCPNLNNVR